MHRPRACHFRRLPLLTLTFNLLPLVAGERGLSYIRQTPTPRYHFSSELYQARLQSFSKFETFLNIESMMVSCKKTPEAKATAKAEAHGDAGAVKTRRSTKGKQRPTYRRRVKPPYSYAELITMAIKVRNNLNIQ